MFFIIYLGCTCNWKTNKIHQKIEPPSPDSIKFNRKWYVYIKYTQSLFPLIGICSIQQHHLKKSWNISFYDMIQVCVNCKLLCKAYTYMCKFL